MQDQHSQNITHVLISGGGGLIGKYLTSLLLAEGYRVSHLSRNQDQFGKVRVYRWDPSKGILAPSVVDGVDYIVHLAGVNIGEGRWTKSRKNEIIRSRVESADLIRKVVSENKIPIRAFITASGINYYGTTTSEKVFCETDLPGTDFPATVCKSWEEAADRFSKEGIRTVKLRTAVVLDKDKGALPRLILPTRYGILAIPGSGNQFLPWIHINDLCRIYLKAIQNSNMAGVYNAVAPHHVTNFEFLRTVDEILNRRLIKIRVPAIFLEIFFGKMSSLILEGSRVSPEKIKNAGYRFEFDNLHNALTDIISPRSASQQP